MFSLMDVISPLWVLIVSSMPSVVCFTDVNSNSISPVVALNSSLETLFSMDASTSSTRIICSARDSSTSVMAPPIMVTSSLLALVFICASASVTRSSCAARAESMVVILSDNLSTLSWAAFELISAPSSLTTIFCAATESVTDFNPSPSSATCDLSAFVSI